MIKRISKQTKLSKILFLSSIVLLIASAIFAIIMSYYVDDLNIDGMSKSHYLLMFFQCILGILALLLPSFIEKKLLLDIPSFIEITFLVFILAAIFLGEVRFFYYKVPNWDLYLHVFSGMFICLVAYSVINILNASSKINFKLTAGFIAVFTFSFALAILTLWEIYEYGMDTLAGFNMQKFIPQELVFGENLTQEEALEILNFYNTRKGQQFAVKDTMDDLIVGSLGALIISVIGYISMKLRKNWIKKVLINSDVNQLDVVSINDEKSKE